MKGLMLGNKALRKYFLTIIMYLFSMQSIFAVRGAKESNEYKSGKSDISRVWKRHEALFMENYREVNAMLSDQSNRLGSFLIGLGLLMLAGGIVSGMIAYVLIGLGVLGILLGVGFAALCCHLLYWALQLILSGVAINNM